MTKTLKVDKEVIDSIEKSSKKFGQLYPVLVDINGKLIDGENRKKVFENPSIKKLGNIKTKKDRLEARLVANHARKGQHKQTWVLTLDQLALILEREGVESIGIQIAKETGLPYRTLMRYLPSQFKNQAQSIRASHPRLPHGTPLPEETETSTSASSLVQSPAKTKGEVHVHQSQEKIPASEILEDFKPLVGKAVPKIEIKRFPNQPWKAIILPRDFFEKLESACSKSRVDMEEVVSLALLKLLEDLRRKNRCLGKDQ